jgi:hypothetical protein
MTPKCPGRFGNPSTLLFNGYLRSFRGSKATEHKAEPLIATSAEIKKEWSYTSNIPQVFTACTTSLSSFLHDVVKYGTPMLQKCNLCYDCSFHGGTWVVIPRSLAGGHRRFGE